jgi:hypothetical protein
MMSLKFSKSSTLERRFELTVNIPFDSIVCSYGRVAERLGKGLQNPVLRFNSGRDLKNLFSPSGEIGIHKGLKIPRQKCHASSSLASGTSCF